MIWTLLLFLVLPSLPSWIGPGGWPRRLLVYASTFGAMVLTANVIGGTNGVLAAIFVALAILLASMEWRTRDWEQK